MPDRIAELVKTHNLHTLKSVGHHLTSSARDKGQSTAKPLAFVCVVTIVLGAELLWEVFKQTEAGRGDGRWSR